MQKTPLDENAQPRPAIRLADNEIKAVNTLYGIVMGITADQVIADSEIYFLDLWLKDNADYDQAFPLNIIKRRVSAILADGIITDDERDDLYQTLLQIQGGSFLETGAAGGLSNAVIFDDPASLTIKNATFCLTGQFVSGPRDKCEFALKKFGGIPSKNITANLDYLVVGTIRSRDWIATGHGRKIEKALHYKQKGVPITIISEEILLKFISIV